MEFQQCYAYIQHRTMLTCDRTGRSEGDAFADWQTLQRMSVFGMWLRALAKLRGLRMDDQGSQ